MHTRVLVISLLSGCTAVYHQDLNKRQCQVDADCASDAVPGLACIDSVCQEAPCQPACGAGSLCIEGACAAEDARRCTQDSQCAASERCGYNGVCYSKWGCTNTPADWPAAPASFHVKTSLRRIDTNGLDLSAVGDVNVIACAAEDPLCEEPVLRNPQTTLSDDKQLDMEFEGLSGPGFTGIIEISPTLADAYLPTFVHVPDVSPWGSEFVTEKATYLGSAAIGSLLSMFAGVEADLNPGLAGFLLYDCGGRPASGVQVVSMSDPDVPFIPMGPGNIPQLNQRATTDEGVGFMIDLPVGKPAVFELRDPLSQAALAPALSFVVQGDGLNVVSYYPRYSAMQAWMANVRRTAK